MSTTVLTIVSVLAVLAQAPSEPEKDEAPAIERVTLTGKVREVGGGPLGKGRAVLDLDDKTELVLHGASPADEGELRRLAGTRIKVIGVKNDPSIPRGNHVRVDRYEIVDAGGGAVPKIGRIAELELNGKTRLIFVDEDGHATFLPESWLRKMQQHVGAKIWVVGNRSEVKGELVPARFALLRPVPDRED